MFLARLQIQKAKIAEAVSANSSYQSSRKTKVSTPIILIKNPGKKFDSIMVSPSTHSTSLQMCIDGGTTCQDSSNAKLGLHASDLQHANRHPIRD
ncbi:TPA: hypothetical protein EYN65_06525 [Candidatus Poribacteria bacterium]|jgi:uncharacterized protein YraI|nr:hypothetical protein [Candidatus Poribacteria bacterium]HIC03581.1 hypothetical protein [Candidatus Poribacteria bacterium]HIO05337.1 hypothetical protein [Candidatus Poribacteria bacterium]